MSHITVSVSEKTIKTAYEILVKNVAWEKSDTQDFGAVSAGYHEEQFKFLVPCDLKASLQKLADERNISLSALMRLIASEYVKRHHGT